MSESPSQSTHALVGRRVQYRYCELCGAQVQPHAYGHDSDCPRNSEKQTGTPGLTGHSQEHRFELDPHDQIDCIELVCYQSTRQNRSFRVVYVTIRLTDGKPWYISASGPGFHAVTGIALGGGYLRNEYHSWSAAPEEVRAVIRQHLTLGNEYQ